MYICIIQLLLVLNGVVGIVCPYANKGITSYFTFTVDLLYGNNAACSGSEEMELRETINDALSSLILTNTDGPPLLVTGEICTDETSNDDDEIVHRKLLLINSFTWVGRAVCQLCSPDKKLRRLTEQSIAAEEAAHRASIDLTNLIIMTHVDDEASCLFGDWATAVVVRVSEITQAASQNPCE